VITSSTLSSNDISNFAEAFADSYYQNVFREEEIKSHSELKQGHRTPTCAQSNAFNALSAQNNGAPRTADHIHGRAKAFSLVPGVTSAGHLRYNEASRERRYSSSVDS